MAKTKEIINLKNKHVEYFEWTIIAALHHREIKDKAEHIAKLQRYKNQFIWHGIDLPIAIQNICKLENRNPEIVVKTLLLIRAWHMIRVDGVYPASLLQEMFLSAWDVPW